MASGSWELAYQIDGVTVLGFGRGRFFGTLHTASYDATKDTAGMILRDFLQLYGVDTLLAKTRIWIMNFSDLIPTAIGVDRDVLFPVSSMY
jgi:hypothetical protein